MKSRCHSLLIGAGLGWVALVAPVAGAELRVVGSDLLGLEFSKSFYRFAGRAGLRLALAFDGSRSGLGELAAGRADLAIVSLPAGERAALDRYRVVTLGYHRVVALAAKSCPLEQISVPELARVFGVGVSGGAAVRWGELGVEGDWRGAAVIALAPEVGTGIALELFRHAVLGGGELRAGVRRLAGANALATELAGGERALAVAGAMPRDATRLKVLPVAVAPGMPAHAPTIEALQSGRYPLGLPVHLVFPARGLAALTAALEFLLGDEAARLLAEVEIVPLPAPARAEAQRSLSGDGR